MSYIRKDDRLHGNARQSALDAGVRHDVLAPADDGCVGDVLQFPTDVESSDDAGKIPTLVLPGQRRAHVEFLSPRIRPDDDPTLMKLAVDVSGNHPYPILGDDHR